MDRSLLVALRLSGRRCLVIGSGEDAAHRARQLQMAGAHVGVLGSVEEMAGVDREARSWTPDDLKAAWLVVLTDRDADAGARLATACEVHKVLFCAVDQPAFNSFNHVAIARQGAVSCGISTEGHAPALARRLKEELERELGHSAVVDLVQDMTHARAEPPGPSRTRALTKLARALSLRITIDR